MTLDNPVPGRTIRSRYLNQDGRITMQVKRSIGTKAPKYPSFRQYSESRALVGLATLGLSAVTGLSGPAAKNERPIALGGVMVVNPKSPRATVTNNVVTPKSVGEQRLPGEMMVDPKPRTKGKMVAEPSSRHPAGTRYCVKEGDTLSGLARQYLGSSNRWQEITVVNPGLTPANLKAGLTITIPAKK
jgi:nucleoid-associated protein YgaU